MNSPEDHTPENTVGACARIGPYAQSPRFSYWFEAAALFLLLFISGVHLLRINDSWQQPVRELMARESVFFAAGRGYGNVYAAIPELDAFLSGNQAEFNIAQLPEDMELHPAEDYSHYYLMATLGLFWRVFGVSHASYNALIALFMLLSVLLTYLLARIAMGRLISLGVALCYLFNPFMLEHYQSSLRDVSKMPFFLATIALLALLIRTPPTTRKLLKAAFVAGTVIGIGFGFRNDMNVLLPLSIPVFLFCPGEKIGPKGRAAAVAVLVLMAGLLGLWTASLSKDTTRLNLWRITCGFASRFDHDQNLAFGSYERLPFVDDRYGVFTAQNRYPDLTVPADSTFMLGELTESTGAFRDYVVTTFLIFPADMLARIYGATLVILQRVPLDGLPFRGGAWIGPVCAFFTLMLLFARDYRSGFLGLYLLLGFCGYTSLQFDLRHTFHLYFMPLWFIGAALHLAIAGCVAAARLPKPLSGPQCARIRQRFFRVLLAAPLVIVLLWLPLVGLRFIQSVRVRQILTEYETAPGIPVLASSTHDKGRTLYRVQPQDDCVSEQRSPDALFTRTELYMVHLAHADALSELRMEYESSDGWSHCVSVRLEEPVHAGEVRIFFPAYDYVMGNAFAWFTGISLPEHQADAFRGVYRISRESLTAPALILAVPDAREAFLPWQRLRMPWHPSGFNPLSFSEDTGAFPVDRIDPTDADAAEQALADFMTSHPRHAFARIALTVLRAHQDNHAAALDIALELVDAYPDYETVQRGLGERLLYHSPDSAMDLLLAIEARRPQIPCFQAVMEFMRVRQARSYCRQGFVAWHTGDPDRAVSLMEAALELSPEYPDAMNGLAAIAADLEQRKHGVDAGLPEIGAENASQSRARHYAGEADRLHAQGQFEEAALLYGKALELAPGDLWPLVRLGEVYEAMGKVEAALNAYQKVLMEAPESPVTAQRMDALMRRIQDDPHKRIDLWRDLIKGHPNSTTLLSHLGAALECAGEADAAADAYISALDPGPKGSRGLEAWTAFVEQWLSPGQDARSDGME